VLKELGLNRRKISKKFFIGDNVEYEEVYKKIKALEDDDRLEDKEYFEDGMSLFWAEYVDVFVNGQLILASNIVLDNPVLELYGAIGMKSFELEEIWELDIDAQI